MPEVLHYCEGCPRGTTPATQRVRITFTDRRPQQVSYFCELCSARIGRMKYLLSIEREAV